MAMLERYRRPGGFLQLLALIEACSPSKQEKLLDTVATEDRIWATTIRSKMLNIDRIFSWSDETLMEILGSLQDLTVAVAIHSAPEPLKSRISNCVSHGRRRKIEDLFGTKEPTPGEVSAMHVKIIESVRKMGTDGLLRFEKFDPALIVDENIDDRLMHPSGPARPEASLGIGSSDSVDTIQAKLLHSYSPLSAHQAAQSTPAATARAGEVVEARAMELQLMKKRVAELSKENAVLRHELSIARSKLDQIKKIA